MKFLNWDICSYNRETAVKLYREGINPLVSVFLASKGIESIQDARMMLGEIPCEMYDPFLMKDIDKAARRISTAIENKERIAVYGDYDVDGMTSCAVLSLWLKAQGADYEVYIPDRLNEGYCLNMPALDTLKSRGVVLVVTVDCGVTAIEEANYAKSIGMDLIITDHHECRTQLPEAIAVIDPKRPDCEYPNKYLAGVGVSFKLVCALEHNREMGESGHSSKPDFEDLFKKYSDLVAVGTVADVMPISGENRELIRRGLQVLNDTPRLGIKSLLLKAMPQPGRITTTTISYTLAPRLNAAGRMGKAPLSLELLIADAESDTEELVCELCRLNDERRDCESYIYDEVLSMLSDSDMTKPLIIANEGWHQGVTGIVASKLADRFRMPIIIISIDENGIGRGTCRSFGTFNLYQAISSCDDILIDYGGHEAAAGITISHENVDELRKRIVDFYDLNYPLGADSGLRLDFEVLKPELLTVQNLEAIKLLEPFGNNNPYPSLCIKGAELLSLQSIGDGKHTRFRVNKSGTSFNCIYFSMPIDELGVANGELVDIAFEPQINEFRDQISVQLNVLDIRKAE